MQDVSDLLPICIFLIKINKLRQFISNATIMSVILGKLVISLTPVSKKFKTRLHCYLYFLKTLLLITSTKKLFIQSQFLIFVFFVLTLNEKADNKFLFLVVTC